VGSGNFGAGFACDDVGGVPVSDGEYNEIALNTESDASLESTLYSLVMGSEIFTDEIDIDPRKMYVKLSFERKTQRSELET
jgi:hypothetical protein